MNIGDLIAQMMDAARWVALKEGCDRRLVPQRLQQLDLGIRQRDEHYGHAVIGLRQRIGDLRSERRSILGDGGRKVRHGNSDVIEASDHVSPPGVIITTPEQYASRQAVGASSSNATSQRGARVSSTLAIGRLPQARSTAARTARRTASRTISPSRADRAECS